MPQRLLPPAYLFLAFAAAAAQPPDPKLQKQLDEWVAQLGDDEFARREGATAKLKAAGKSALASLRLAVKSDDPEVRHRARVLLEIIDPTIPSVSLLRVQWSESIPLKGKYKQIEVVEISGRGRIEGADLDAEEITIGSITGRGKVVLKGKVKKLTIGSINGSGELDASGLAAGSVEIGEINRRAKVSVLSAGSVRFKDSVDGTGSVSVKARGDIRFAGRLDGAVRVELDTRGNVLLDEGVGGTGTLKVTRCKDFTASKGVSGSARVEVGYTGKAKCVGSPGTTIDLKAIPAGT